MLKAVIRFSLRYSTLVLIAAALGIILTQSLLQGLAMDLIA